MKVRESVQIINKRNIKIWCKMLPPLSIWLPRFHANAKRRNYTPYQRADGTFLLPCPKNDTEIRRMCQHVARKILHLR